MVFYPNVFVEAFMREHSTFEAYVTPTSGHSERHVLHTVRASVLSGAAADDEGARSQHASSKHAGFALGGGGGHCLPLAQLPDQGE